jgi:hypothetical protein
VALPRMAGRTKGGALGSAVCSSWATVKPALRMKSRVGRLQSQHTTSRFSQFSRSCRRAVPGSPDRTCSMNSRQPPGRSTRRISRPGPPKPAIQSPERGTAATAGASSASSRSEDVSAWCASSMITSTGRCAAAMTSARSKDNWERAPSGSGSSLTRWLARRERGQERRAVHQPARGGVAAREHAHYPRRRAQRDAGGGGRAPGPDDLEGAGGTRSGPVGGRLGQPGLADTRFAGDDY